MNNQDTENQKIQDAIRLLASLENSDKEKYRDDISKALEVKKTYTKKDAIRDIKKLPQAEYIDDMDLLRWISKVEEIDPERLEWHVRRLGGFGGSEIGVLWMNEREMYHPFEDAQGIVRNKLLMDQILDPEGNLIRGSMMEDAILRPLYRKTMQERLEALGHIVRFRDDLMDQFMYFKDSDPELAWLIGSPDELMEVDGKLIIIDYKAPTSNTIEAYRSYGPNEAPIYYEAQLHHYATIAQKLGIEVSGLQLASLNYNKFEFDLREIPLRKEFQEELLAAGSHYWKNVIQGQVPLKSMKKVMSADIPLPEHIAKAATMYAATSIILNAATAARKNIKESMQSPLMGVEFDPNVDSIISGMVAVNVERTYDIKALAEDMESEGISTVPAFLPNEFDEKKVEEILKLHYNCSDFNDAVFDDIRVSIDGEKYTYSPKALVEIARANNFNIGPYIMTEYPSLELTRSKLQEAPYIKEIMNEEWAPKLEKGIQEMMGVYTRTFDDVKERSALRKRVASEARQNAIDADEAPQLPKKKAKKT